jgi:cellulose synthase operon protein C
MRRAGMATNLQQDLFLDAPRTPPIGALEAMRLGNFREAIKLYKQLLKQHNLPEWSEGLAQAYAARASQLAAKGMYEEAQIVLDNTAAPDGTVRDPLLYIQCLIKRGQHGKAAEHALKYVGTSKVPPAQAARLAEVTAALSLTAPWPSSAATEKHTERGRWFEQATAARQALTAWIEGKPLAEIDELLARISLRSDFKAVRLILKALITAPSDPDRARQLVQGIAVQSPFTPLRLAVEAALSQPSLESLASGIRSSGPEQAFVLQLHGLSDSGSHSLAELLKAESGGPSSLFTFLLKQAEIRPGGELRSACLNLLPRIPDRSARFEKTFGPLSAFDKNRILALAAEARQDWDGAGRHWSQAAQSLEALDTPQARVQAGVIFRHLAELADRYEEVGGAGDDPAISYLVRSRRSDPDHLPTVLKLIAKYRAAGERENWDCLVEEALKRFAKTAIVLQHALEWARERKDLGRALEFAHELLALDPINASLRQDIIDLRILRAREMIHAKRFELAQQELAEAKKVEQPQAPSVPLRLNEALLGLRLAQDADAEIRLREAMDLAGGGMPGWFLASLQDALMKGGGDGSFLRRELVAAQKLAPTKQAILSIGSAAASEAARQHSALVARLIFRIRGWLCKGGGLDWSVKEFQPIAEILKDAEAYQVLGAYAKLGCQRDPDEPLWRLYWLMARTKGDRGKLTYREATELAEQAAESENYHEARLIGDFLDSGDDFEDAPARATPSSLTEQIMEMIDASMRDLSPEQIRQLVATGGKTRAVKVVANRLKNSEVGALFPTAAIRSLANEIVESALGKCDIPRSLRELPPW